MAHYTKEELDLYRHDQMSVLGRIGCAAHLKNCPECRKLLDELEEEDRFVNDLRNSVRLYKDLSAPPPSAKHRTSTGA